jgi:hypothetical protein
MRHWRLIVADFRREYGIGPVELAVMGSREFGWLLAGLSSDAVYRLVAENAPAELRGARAAAAMEHW